LVLTCATGYRSSIAASILGKSGFDKLSDLVGGFQAYRTVEQPGPA